VSTKPSGNGTGCSTDTPGCTSSLTQSLLLCTRFLLSHMLRRSSVAPFQGLKQPSDSVESWVDNDPLHGTSFPWNDLIHICTSPRPRRQISLPVLGSQITGKNAHGTVSTFWRDCVGPQNVRRTEAIMDGLS